jgi:hypothetical protein
LLSKTIRIFGHKIELFFSNYSKGTLIKVKMNQTNHSSSSYSLFGCTNREAVLTTVVNPVAPVVRNPPAALPTSARTTPAPPQPAPAPEIMMEGITTALKLLSDRYHGYYDPPNAIRIGISRNFKNLFPAADSAAINSILYNDGDDTSMINDLHQGYDLSIAYVDQYMRLARLECAKIKRQLQTKKLSLNRIVEEKRKALEDEAQYNAGAEEREQQVLVRIQKLPDDLIRLIAEYAYTPDIRSLILELKYDFSDLLPKLKITVKQMRALYYRFKQVNQPIAKGLNKDNRKEAYGAIDFGNKWAPMSKSDGNMTKKEQFIAKMLSVMNKLKTLSLSTGRFHNTKNVHRTLSKALLENYKLFTYVSKRFAPVPRPLPSEKITKQRKPRTPKQAIPAQLPSQVIDLTND